MDYTTAAIVFLALSSVFGQNPPPFSSNSPSGSALTPPSAPFPPPAGVIVDYVPSKTLTPESVTLPSTAGDIPVTYGQQTVTNHPEQIFLSPATRNGSFFYVTWITPKYSGKGTVYYGISSLNKKSTCTGTPYLFGVGTPLQYRSGPIFHCILGPLTPNSVYTYQLSGSTTNYTFKSFPAVGTLNPSSTLKIGFMADVGQTYNSSTTYDHAALAGLDVVLFPGDLTYADRYGGYAATCTPYNGTETGFSTCQMGGRRWDSAFRLASKLFANVPVVFNPGNHELEFNFVYKILTPYTAYLARVPAQIIDQPAPIPVPPLYYSQNIGLVHVINLATYTAFVKYSHQYSWLLADLASINRTVTPWVIVSLHTPVYNSNAGHYREGESFRKQWEATLYANKVDLVVAGHVHNYERSMPVFDERPNACGPTYITIGDGGNIETFSGKFLNPQPVYSAYRESSFGFAQLEVFNSSTAVYTWYRNQNATLTVSDTFVLTNKKVACP